MPDQLNRLAPLVRLVSLVAAVLLAAQVTLVPAATVAVAAAAYADDELTDVPTHDEEQLAAEPATDEGEHGAESGAVEGEPAAELTADDGEPAAEAGDASTDGPADVEEAAATEPADATVEEEAVAEPAPEIPAVSAAPAIVDDPVADAFLIRLLDAINARRARNGTQHLAYVPSRANAALDGFLATTVGEIRWPAPCMHHLVDGAFSWEHVSATGFGGEARGEVLACPGPEPYWTPDRAAEQWWESPIHFDVLYADPDANALACSAYGVRGGSNNQGKKNTRSSGSAEAASAVLCVTFRD